MTAAAEQGSISGLAEEEEDPCLAYPLTDWRIAQNTGNTPISPEYQQPPDRICALEGSIPMEFT